MALYLASTAAKIRLTTSVAGLIETHASYADYNPANSPPVTIGTNNESITGAATTDVVDPPAASTSRNVKFLSIANSHASLANVVTIIHTDGTVPVELEEVTLLAGERIAIRDGVPTRVIDANGVEKNNGSAAVFTKVLSADDANSTVTADKVTGLDFSLAVGTYMFEYMVVYQSAATTTGAKFGCNFTGTNGIFSYTLQTPTALATAADGNHDQDILTATGGLFNVWAARAKSTSAPMIGAGVDTINADLMAYIQGLVVVTATGTLELYSASEVAASAVTVKAGSSLRLTKVA